MTHGQGVRRAYAAGMERVLIIDDNRDVRALLKTALTEAGYEAHAVAEGGAALAQQELASADLVVTDLYMPGMEGIETIAKLRKRYPRTKIIAMSGGSRFGTDRANTLAIALEIGADAILRKPFNPERLIAVVHRVLGHAPDGGLRPAGEPH